MFPVFAKKNEGFSFADEHAGAASSVQTLFLKANLVAVGPGSPISSHEMSLRVVPLPLRNRDRAERGDRQTGSPEAETALTCA